jgi:hypothetical protein
MAEPIFRVSADGEFWPHTWVVYGDLVMSLTREGQVPDRHWALYTEDLRRSTIRVVLGLGVGAMSVNSRQRRSAALALHDKRVAAVLNSSVARGIATAFSWLGLQLRSFAFSESQVLDAFTYLDSAHLTPEQGLELAERLLVMSGSPPIAELSTS